MPINFKFVRRVGNYLASKFKVLRKLVKKLFSGKSKWKYFIAADINYKEPTSIIVLARDEKSGQYHMAFMKNTGANANLEEIKCAIGDLARKYGISDRKDVFLDTYSGYPTNALFENSVFESFNQKSTKPTKNKPQWRDKRNGK